MRIWVCPTAIQCRRQCRNMSSGIHWQISPNKVEKVKAALTAMSARPRLDGLSVKAKREYLAQLETAPSWMILNKEWAAFQRWRRKWTAGAEGGVVGGDGGWPKPSEQTALLVQSYIFKVTALTDTIRPRGCLQGKILLPFRGNDRQFCMVLNIFHYTAGEIVQAKRCSVIKRLEYLCWVKDRSDECSLSQ